MFDGSIEEGARFVLCAVLVAKVLVLRPGPFKSQVSLLLRMVDVAYKGLKRDWVGQTIDAPGLLAAALARKNWLKTNQITVKMQMIKPRL